MPTRTCRRPTSSCAQKRRKDRRGGARQSRKRRKDSGRKMRRDSGRGVRRITRPPLKYDRTCRTRSPPGNANLLTQNSNLRTPGLPQRSQGRIRHFSARKLPGLLLLLFPVLLLLFCPVLLPVLLHPVTLLLPRSVLLFSPVLPMLLLCRPALL